MANNNQIVSLSRYAEYSSYYNKRDKKYSILTTRHLDNTSTSGVSHTLDPYDTPYTLALKYYGRPDWYWVILDYNRIQNPDINLYEYGYTSIFIPDIYSIELEAN